MLSDPYALKIQSCMRLTSAKTQKPSAGWLDLIGTRLQNVNPMATVRWLRDPEPFDLNEEPLQQSLRWEYRNKCAADLPADTRTSIHAQALGTSLVTFES